MSITLQKSKEKSEKKTQGNKARSLVVTCIWAFQQMNIKSL